jgi:hypothetical protein
MKIADVGTCFNPLLENADGAGAAFTASPREDAGEGEK